jgi:Protein of unknown function (DUF3052)
MRVEVSPKMAGYSATPLPKKLGIKAGHHVAVIGAPAGFDQNLGELPAVAALYSSLAGSHALDVVLLFVVRRAELEKRLAAIRKRLAQAGGLWVVWPKKKSGVPTDLNENIIREIILPTGLVDNKVCAIDEVWSGLRLVIRRELRQG